MKGDELFLLPSDPWGEPRLDECAVIGLPPDATIRFPPGPACLTRAASPHERSRRPRVCRPCHHSYFPPLDICRPSLKSGLLTYTYAPCHRAAHFSAFISHKTPSTTHKRGQPREEAHHHYVSRFGGIRRGKCFGPDRSPRSDM